MAAIKVGDRVPNFSLPSQTGTTVNVSDLIGKKSLVIYFYPKDDTPGCTAESCAFRDSYEVFTDAGAEVIGISADSPQSHQQFAQKYNLPFTLLSDSDNRVRKLFGVPSTLFVLPGRVTYIIDQEGIVRHIFDSMLDFKAHVTESLNTIKSF
ncbi:MAG: peroxiredoxin [Microcystis aeruginosa Ma_QC_Ch_20071001_S25]|jgi:peroxiredoxin Q/BCP|uniref:thioredoxin-dependent peroxiredoxin n=3 Tax=Microcystis aeruginosa TaxID=1126 RepID=A0A552FZP2_MICAE|nr:MULTISPECIES: peroxiredoxin [unclassified Microcystis]MCA2925746.1 peroxiredoxin [Microcystis sp. M020S1]MCA2933368.1 peroxiredoxin [Microcystis sp. M015S1]NCQ69960.1 peroxiredoxin [Microcystis aeruginosa W13-16]NCQ74491.1 peroxiredoxin [Microcystis aeruginosa W13-13]NCQ78957.1 peroxiredoxin [Microcystis aeruginosa W13-15]NCQ84826.1 peroxiredoxin [Microcystis aeruginosa W13-18]NCR12717.1 peroxiredoxin [Microcystis aeruginosa SX13-11]NCR16699.1 peroxiredoxin [Microcystis aeruginosa LL13-0